MSGPLKLYDVSGKDVLGDGRPAPDGTVLRLKRPDAERLGLEKPAKKTDDETAPAAKPRSADAAKPRRATTRKRSAPSKKA